MSGMFFETQCRHATNSLHVTKGHKNMHYNDYGVQSCTVYCFTKMQ